MTLDDIKGVLVVGAGSMGSQIAMQAALHGYRVTLNDLTTELLEQAMKGNREQLARRVAKGQMTQAQMDAAVGRIRPFPTPRSKRMAAGTMGTTAPPKW